MGHEASEIYRMLGGPHRMPVDVDGDQIGGGHLAVVETEWIDEEDCLWTRYAQGDVIEDRLRPSQVIEDPVAGCKSSARLALRFGDWYQTLAGAGRLVHEQAFSLCGL
jgi:hypothetical protein